MERMGFKRGMDTLLASPMVVTEAVTDGHLEIAALSEFFFAFEKKNKCTVPQNY